jgi:hypothetical protein
MFSRFQRRDRYLGMHMGRRTDNYRVDVVAANHILPGSDGFAAESMRHSLRVGEFLAGDSDELVVCRCLDDRRTTATLQAGANDGYLHFAFSVFLPRPMSKYSKPR